MDWWNKLTDRAPGWFKTIFDHNRWKTATIICFTTFGGCMLMGSKTTSIEDPSKQVNRDQLYAEYQTFLAKYEAATKDLDAKDAMRERALEVLQQLSTSLPLPFAPLAGTGIGILLGAAGGTLDKRRADKQIEALKTKSIK